MSSHVAGNVATRKSTMPNYQRWIMESPFVRSARRVCRTFSPPFVPFLLSPLYPADEPFDRLPSRTYSSSHTGRVSSSRAQS